MRHLPRAYKVFFSIYRNEKDAKKERERERERLKVILKLHGIFYYTYDAY